MYNYIKTIFLIYVLAHTYQLCGQEIPDKNIAPLIEEIVENQSENYDESTDFSEISTELYYLNQHPINLNNTSPKELSRLVFLSGAEINSILKYVDFYGPVKTIYELQAADNISRQSLRWLSSFITFEEKQNKPDHNRWWFNHELLYRTDRKLEQQKGYLSDSIDEPAYLGDPYRQYFRYHAESRNLSAGITADKDGGEPFFKGSNSDGFDFYSGHLKVENLGFIDKVVLGDYKLQFGQGLSLWSGFSMGKSPTLSGIKKYGYGVKAYRSSNESSYMRGIGFTVSRGNFSFTPFYSRKKWDGNREYLPDSTDYWVTSLKEGGYHRTPSELENQNSVAEHMGGFNLSFDKNRWHAGFTGWHSKYSHPVKPQDRLYNYFRFHGKKNYIAGLDISKVFNQGQFFGEWAIDKDGDMALMAGSNFFLHSRLTLKTVYRNYSKSYNNPYSNGLAEGSRTNDEEGILVGMVFLMFDNFTLNGYADFFKTRWMGFRTSSPATGQEYSLQLNYIPSRNFNSYLRFQSETKDYNSSSEDAVEKTIPRERKKLRLHLSYELTDQLSLKNRIEKSFINFSENKSEGFLLYQDVRYLFKNIPLTLNGRFAVFDTDDYSSRLYAYESDVLYTFSFPAYYDEGRRFYLVAKYEIVKGFTAWLRFSRTMYNHRQTVLSGYNEIQGNAVSEVKFQIRVKF